MLMLFQVFFIIFLGKCVVWEHLTEFVLSYNWLKPFLWPVRSKYASVFPCDFNILYRIYVFFFFWLAQKNQCDCFQKCQFHVRSG